MLVIIICYDWIHEIVSTILNNDGEGLFGLVNEMNEKENEFYIKTNSQQELKLSYDEIFLLFLNYY